VGVEEERESLPKNVGVKAGLCCCMNVCYSVSKSESDLLNGICSGLSYVVPR
jgi:hypothetical protein